jgi:hypothetical protein
MINKSVIKYDKWVILIEIRIAFLVSHAFRRLLFCLVMFLWVLTIHKSFYCVCVLSTKNNLCDYIINNFGLFLHCIRFMEASKKFFQIKKIFDLLLKIMSPLYPLQRKLNLFIKLMITISKLFNSFENYRILKHFIRNYFSIRNNNFSFEFNYETHLN